MDLAEGFRATSLERSGMSRPWHPGPAGQRTSLSPCRERPGFSTSPCAAFGESLGGSPANCPAGIIGGEA